MSQSNDGGPAVRALKRIANAHHPAWHRWAMLCYWCDGIHPKHDAGCPVGIAHRALSRMLVLYPERTKGAKP